MMFYVHPELKTYFTANKIIFETFMSLKGVCFRKQPGRLTQEIMLNEQYYFIKQHIGVGWKEIIKNLLQLKKPVVSAFNEWAAIKKCQTLGILTPQIAAYGKKGWHPASLQSFILTKALKNTQSLEEICKNWQLAPPAFCFKLNLLKEIARIARLLHSNGMNHRDFYLCHFLLDKNSINTAYIKLFLIDLHRTQIRKKTPIRWIIKDLAGLYFSSKEIGLTLRDLLRFRYFYHQQSLRLSVAKDNSFWQKIIARGEKLYRDHYALATTTTNRL